MDKTTNRGAGVTGLLLTVLAFTIGVVLIMAWLIGWFSPKIAGEHRASDRPIGDARLEPVRALTLARSELAVGTVRPIAEATVAARILARVLEIRVRAGQKVAKGEVAVRLDRADLEARLEQARAELSVAEAERDQAATDLRRSTALLARQAASQMELDRATTAMRTADAVVEQARQLLRERETALSYATVTAPFSGRVVDKKVEAGDLVSPGQKLFALYDPARMQVVASVPEARAARMRVGDPSEILLDSAGKTCPGEVSEIVPESTSTSRTFSVKVIGTCGEGVYSGTFGRIRIPIDEHVETLVVPRAALQHVGQLDMVDVAVDGKRARRIVQLGRDYPNGDVQVLAGLKLGESVVLSATGEGIRE